MIGPRSLGLCPSCGEHIIAAVHTDIVETPDGPKRWGFKLTGMEVSHNCVGRERNNFPLLTKSEVSEVRN